MLLSLYSSLGGIIGVILFLIACAFAMGVATVQTTATSSLSSEMKTFYDRVLLDRALPVLVYSQFGQSKPLPANGGKTIEFRKFSALATNILALTEGDGTGDSGRGKALTVTAVTATIAQYGDYIVGSDLLIMTAIDPILTETAQLLGEQAGLSLDTICRDIIGAGSNVQYANSKATRLLTAATDILTVLEIRKAVRTLKRGKARPIAGGDYVAICEPGATYDLQSDTAWVSANQYAGSTQIFSGEVGRIYGVRFIESTNALKFAGEGAAGCDIYGTLILGQNAYGMVPLANGALEFIFKPVGSSGAADPFNQKWSSAWKATQTWVRLQEAFMLRIEHGMSG